MKTKLLVLTAMWFATALFMPVASAKKESKEAAPDKTNSQKAQAQ